MTVVSWIAAVLGLAIVLSTLMSVVTSLVLPRRGSSRIQNYAGRGMIKVFTRASHRFETYEARDRFLALQAPVSPSRPQRDRCGLFASAVPAHAVSGIAA